MENLLSYLKLLKFLFPSLKKREYPVFIFWASIPAIAVFFYFSTSSTQSVTNSQNQEITSHQQQTLTQQASTSTYVDINDNHISDVPESNFVENIETQEFVESDWDTRQLNLGDDGYYCPRINSNLYYYAWFKKEIPLVGHYFIKILTKPSDTQYINDSGEFVVKMGKNDDLEFSELYFPARNKQTIQYKQLQDDVFSFVKPGGQLTTLVKVGTPIEILQTVNIKEGNRVNADFYLVYLGKTTNSTRITDPLSYSTFSVDDTNPLDIMTNIGVGVDKHSCFKIESIGFNISDKVFKSLLDK